jgi:hypothetical protein
MRFYLRPSVKYGNRTADLLETRVSSINLFKILPVLNLMQIRRTAQPLMLGHRQKDERADGRTDMVFHIKRSLLRKEQLTLK